MSEHNQPAKKPIAPIHELLTKEVNRKEFLSIVGFGALAVVGLDPIFKFLTGKGSSKVNVHQESSKVGFGSGPYGV
jgi:hypothetical protein